MKKLRRKHVPQRTCVVCRQKTDKRRLIRIVRTSEEGVVADFTGKRNGRGAYLCQNPACWDKALNSNLLDRALLTNIPQTEKEALLKLRPDVKPSEEHPTSNLETQTWQKQKP